MGIFFEVLNSVRTDELWLGRPDPWGKQRIGFQISYNKVSINLEAIRQEAQVD